MQSAGGLGGIALASMLGEETLRADEPALRVLHHPPKAKRVVQLFMSGAASHLDLFDYKPELIKRHGEPSDFGEHVEVFQNGLGPWLRPIWDFKPYGESGKMLSDVVADLGDVGARSDPEPHKPDTHEPGAASELLEIIGGAPLAREIAQNLGAHRHVVLKDLPHVSRGVGEVNVRERARAR